MVSYTYTPYAHLINPGLSTLPNDYYRTYGQSGSPYTPQPFFQRTPGQSITINTEDFGSRPQMAMPEYKQPDMPSFGDSLLGLGASYAANKFGQAAGQDYWASMQVDPQNASFWGSMAEGPGIATGDFIDTVSSIPGKISDAGQSVADWFGNTPSYSPTATPVAAASPLAQSGAGFSAVDAPAQSVMNSNVPTDWGFSDPSEGSIVTGPGNVGASASYTAAPLWEGGSFGQNMQFGGLQTGLFSGATTFGLGLLQGQSVGEAAKSAADAGIGTAIGYAVGGPIGGFIGGAVGGMFRVICTELTAQGYMTKRDLRAEEWYTLRKIHPLVVRGYHIWALPYVRVMQKSERFSRFTNWWAGARAQEILYQCGLRKRPHYGGKLVRLIVEPASFLIGCVAAALDLSELEWKNGCA